VNRRAVIVGVAGAVVLSLLWFFLFWSPQGKRLDAAEERQAAAEQTNGQLEVTLARLRDLESRRPELQGQLEQLRRAVPDQPQLARFFLAAHDAATRSGVQLTTISPSKPTASAAATTATTAAPTSGSTTTTTAAAGTSADTVAPTSTAPSAISVSMELTGGYFQVLDFLNRVDDLARIVVVDSLDLGGGADDEAAPSGASGASGGGGGATELTASITARMFTGSAPAGDPATAGATTATTAPTTATTATGTDS
jgi:Tfp pilus assembly protein PilO